MVPLTPDEDERERVNVEANQTRNSNNNTNMAETAPSTALWETNLHYNEHRNMVITNYSKIQFYSDD